MKIINGEVFNTVDRDIEFRHIHIREIINFGRNDHLSFPGNDIESEVLHGRNGNFFHYFFLFIF